MALHRYVCVLILTGFLVLPLYAQQEYLFDSISVEEGLSQSSITRIIQDRQGFLWFGTIDGLNRYDGYEFTIYKHDPDNPNSLPGNVILSIYEAPSEPGVLWVGIEGRGVTRFDYLKGTFTRYQHDLDNSNSLRSNQVFAVHEDREGMLWIGTSEGLQQLDRTTHRHSQIP